MLRPCPNTGSLFGYQKTKKKPHRRYHRCGYSCSTRYPVRVIQNATDYCRTPIRRSHAADPSPFAVADPSSVVDAVTAGREPLAAAAASLADFAASPAAADHAVAALLADFADASPASVHGWLAAAVDSAGGSFAADADFPAASSVAVAGWLAADPSHAADSADPVAGSLA